ncbi:MAG TPA: TatD family hydrolase [bacterium]|nr:TatD family hydrolase [bacterium]HRU90180.1 TatD family hydrolase [Patescibacteria group bacterium]
MRLLDSHAHVNFNAFKDDGDEVIRKSLEAGVGMILVGSEFRTSNRAIDYANHYETGVWAAIGLHPSQLFATRVQGEDYDFMSRGEELDLEKYDKLADFSKVVAIGEIGLDYYRLADINESPKVIKEKQQRVLSQELTLAMHHHLPVIIHCREAHDDLLPLLQDFYHDYRQILPKDKPWGVVHCFSGDMGLAQEYFSLGLDISFNGLITFCSTWDYLIQKMPLDRLLIETDCPFLTPVPFRGQRNEPSLVKLVAERIAQIRHTTIECIAEATTANACRLFNIKW